MNLFLFHCIIKTANKSVCDTGNKKKVFYPKYLKAFSKEGYRKQRQQEVTSQKEKMGGE